MNSPHYKDEANGRIYHYAFNWVGGGYNNVWARNKYDAIVLANSYFGGGTANLVVDESSVKEITGKEDEYHKSLPLWD
tara:strand:- start:234 stop:467 length:234 start_codon:yes stop_codon:yes gene_type:complete